MTLKQIMLIFLVIILAGSQAFMMDRRWAQERLSEIGHLEIFPVEDRECPRCALVNIAELRRIMHNPPGEIDIFLAASGRNILHLGRYSEDGRVEFNRGRPVRGEEFLRIRFNKHEINLMNRAHEKYKIKIMLLPNRQILARRMIRVQNEFLRQYLSGNITITEPKKLSTLYNTKAYWIKWKNSGSLAQAKTRVSIQAHIQMKDIYIAQNVPNTGSYKWDLTKGNWPLGNYYLRIGVIGYNKIAQSEVFFVKKGYYTTITSTHRQQFLTLINNYRKSRNLPVLKYDPCLSKAAQGHSEWMAQSKKFSHTGKNGSQFWQRCKQAGCSCGAENIHHGSVDASGCFYGWKGSPPHNATMLNGSFTRIGLGMKDFYWTSVYR